jgi:membrane associated rhomboid family serine protease
MGIYFLSELETQIGSSNFFTLVILITIILSLFEYTVKTGCSIGISGVLYGLVAYKMFKFKNIDYNIIYTLILLFLFSGDSKISHTGHLLGFIAGLTATYLL